MEAKNEKSKTTLFSQTFEVPESKVPLFFPFLRQAEILTIYAFGQSTRLAKIPCLGNFSPQKLAF